MSDSSVDLFTNTVPAPERTGSQDATSGLPGLETLGDDENGEPASSPLGGYVLERRLGAGGMGEVHVACRGEGAEPIALKTLSRVSAVNLYRFKREFRSLADVEHPNLVRLYELEISARGQAFFTMELLDGVPFVDWVRAGLELGALPALERVERALRQLVDGVLALHLRGYVHRDLKPSNVLVSGEGRVVILDFGLITEFEQSGGEITREGQMLGTPAYMAPEQALGLKVDAAADMYAVGVMLFESLTGKRPSSSWLLLEQRSRSSTLTAELASAPPRLRVACMGMLARDPAERPTAAELLSQLVAHAETSKASLPAPIELFVGRDEELRRLQAAYERSRIQKQAVVMQLRGRSGQGKSTLLREFAAGLERDGCLVLCGRCREQEAMPYKGIDAVVDLISAYLRRLPDAERDSLRPRSFEALSRVFPVLGELWPGRGEQALGPSELRNASWLALRELIGRLAERQALAVLIDDVQWSDVESIQLLQALIRPPHSPRLLLILALRPELTGGEGLRTLADSDLLGDAAERLDLEPLPDSHARTLARVLLSSSARGKADPEGVVLRAGGNPFHIIQLARGGKLSSSSDVDLDALIARRLRTLSSSARALLELVAVAGGSLSVEFALELSHEAGRSGLEGLRQVGVLVDPRDTRADAVEALELSHDRIREVALQTSSPARVVELHAALGEGLLARGAEVYAVVEHLNWTIASEPDGARLRRLAALNLEAAQAGLRACAPSTARRNIEAGLRALARALELGGDAPNSELPSCEELAHTLRIQHARCVSLVGDHAHASKLFDELMASCSDEIAYAEVALMRLDACGVTGRPHDAVRWAIDGLARLGLQLDQEPGSVAALGAVARLSWALRASVREQLDQLAECTDPNGRLRIELLTKMVGPAFVVGGNLALVSIARANLEILSKGRTPSYCFCLALAAMLRCGPMPDYLGAAELAQRSLRLAEESGATRRGITLLLAHVISLHWTRPYVECFAGVESSLETALEEADLEYATYASLHKAGYQFAMGWPLDQILAAAQDAARLANDTGMVEFGRAAQVRVQGCAALSSGASMPALQFEEFSHLYPRCVAMNWAMQTQVFLGDVDAALELGASIEADVDEGLFGFYLLPEFVFYRGLATAMACRSGMRADAKLRRVLRQSEARLARWAGVYSGNLGAHARLLAAERARIAGHAATAQGLYESAAREAESSSPHVAALCWERLAEFMSERGWETLAELPRARALELYEAWGATAKLEQLREAWSSGAR